jgi:diguanylate cyclase (GGDEF)-like protein/PAS domain S-box-containing protein
VATVREPLVVLDADLRVVSTNHSFYEVFAVKPEETEGQLIYDLGNKQWDIPKLRKLLKEILPKSGTFADYEVEHEFPAIGKKIMLLNARKIYSKINQTEMILLAIEDITERKKMEMMLQEREEHFKYMSFHDNLTGLYNRAYLAQELARLGKDLSRSTPISIISIDIDGLKLINDALGHKVGDELLIMAAKIISMPFRKIDMIARIGGDEFSIILPGTDYQAALVKKAEIVKLTDKHNDEKPSRLTNIMMRSHQLK